MSLDNEATREQNLSALIAAGVDRPVVVKSVRLDAITTIANPRKLYDKDELEQLASSIYRHGLLHPVVVRSGPSPEAFDLIAGTRRYKAFQVLCSKYPDDPRWQKIPASVQDHHEGTALKVVQAIENIRRSDLTALETADAIHDLKNGGLSTDEIAKELDYTKRQVDRYMGLATSPEWLRAFTVSVEVAEAQLDESGNRITDDDGKPKFKTKRMAGLGISDISEVLSFWRTLDTWDRKQQDLNKAHRPKAEPETVRAVKKAASAGINGERLKTMLKARQAEVTGAPTSGPNDSQRKTKKPYDVSDERVVIDVSALKAPLAPDELLTLKPGLTKALQALGYTTIKLA